MFLCTAQSNDMRTGTHACTQAPRLRACMYELLLYLLSYSIFLALFLSQHAKNAFSRFHYTAPSVLRARAQIGLAVHVKFRVASEHSINYR